MLAAQHLTLRPHSELHLMFNSPTGFHSKGSTIPFPLPALLFESLIARWKAFSPIALPDLLDEFVEQQVLIQAFRGATHVVAHKGGHAERGFVGAITYRLVQQNPSLHKLNPKLSKDLESAYTPLALTVNMLADYAFFSGAGFKTASGMGMLYRSG